MIIDVDDWHFRAVENSLLTLDLYLRNGQHAYLEVNPIRNPSLDGPQVPEMIVFCEFPGEKMDEGTCDARWIARPPDRHCPWSNVELPPVLLQQINQRIVETHPVS